MKHAAGFSLIELVVTLAVGAIALTVAAPSFKNMMASSRMSAQANMFVTAMNMARNEAVKRRASVVVKTISGTNNWAKGVVVTTLNPPPAGVPVLNARFAVPQQGTVFTSSSGQTQYIFRIPNPTVRVVPNLGDTLTLCDNRVGETGRTITLSPTGRVSVAPSPCS